MTSTAMMTAIHDATNNGSEKNKDLVSGTCVSEFWLLAFEVKVKILSDN